MPFLVTKQEIATMLEWSLDKWSSFSFIFIEIMENDGNVFININIITCNNREFTWLNLFISTRRLYRFPWDLLFCYIFLIKNGIKFSFCLKIGLIFLLLNFSYLLYFIVLVFASWNRFSRLIQLICENQMWLFQRFGCLENKRVCSWGKDLWKKGSHDFW